MGKYRYTLTFNLPMTDGDMPVIKQVRGQQPILPQLDGQLALEE